MRYVKEIKNGEVVIGNDILTYMNNYAPEIFVR